MDRREFLTGGVSALTGCGGSMEYDIQQSPILRQSKNVFPGGVYVNWTPTISAFNPGDLAVSAYSTRYGKSYRFGDLCHLLFGMVVQAGNFTHSTASGSIWITGSPYLINVADESGGLDTTGTVIFSGLTKANYTQFVCSATNVGNLPKIYLTACGSAQARADVNITDFPSGGLVMIVGSLWVLIKNVS